MSITNLRKLPFLSLNKNIIILSVLGHKKGRTLHRAKTLRGIVGFLLGVFPLGGEGCLWLCVCLGFFDLVLLLACFVWILGFFFVFCCWFCFLVCLGRFFWWLFLVFTSSSSAHQLAMSTSEHNRFREACHTLESRTHRTQRKTGVEFS